MPRVLMLAALVVAIAPGVASAANGSDLIVDPNTLTTSLQLRWEYLAPTSCAIVEGCSPAGGYRKLLRFSTQTANIGNQDVFLGNPASNPLFHFSPCHGHYHFGEYAQHAMLNGSGQEVAPGFKNGFCLLDSLRYINDPNVPTSPAYNCGNQGLQRGWSDVYTRGLDCQWIDVTNVPDGTYTLRVTVNPDKVIPEVDYDNNAASVQVAVNEPSGVPHRPDGFFVPGSLVTTEHDGTRVMVRYDAVSCPAASYSLYYGLQNDVSSYAYNGAFCNLGSDGFESLALPTPGAGRMLWFTVVGRTTGTNAMEGGHGFDSSGIQRPLTAVGFCGVVRSQPTIVCQ